MSEFLSLKWGGVKGWEGLTDQSVAILNRYYADGMPFSAMADKPDDARKAILCELIDQIDGEIYLDWENKTVSKNEAKSYVMEYGKPRP